MCTHTHTNTHWVPVELLDKQMTCWLSSSVPELCWVSVRWHCLFCNSSLWKHCNWSVSPLSTWELLWVIVFKISEKHCRLFQVKLDGNKTVIFNWNILSVLPCKKVQLDEMITYRNTLDCAVSEILGYWFKFFFFFFF